jgi:FMN phosphatase YigB (HAD superfamily)
MQVQSQGWRLAIASNFDGRLPGVVRGFPALHEVEHCCVSSAVGWRKPAGEFFLRVEKLLGTGSDQLVMVGDDWDADVNGARRCGWQAEWLQRDRVGDGDHLPTLLSLAGRLSRRSSTEPPDGSCPLVSPDFPV